MNRKLSIAFFILILTIGWKSLFAQERIAPLKYNPVLKNYKGSTSSIAKTTADTLLKLPFFDDFTRYSPFPDGSKWTDWQVYINNTMCVDPVSRGVATFDALNQNGIPYQEADIASLYGDSLTSFQIDLSTSQPSDSIYLSFFYQPQGNGFYPETADSLLLYFKRKTGGWRQVWAVPGNTLQPFRQAMVPVSDTVFLDSFFQFRFVNKASINTNDDVWNIDYVRMAAGRTINDTAINDVAFTKDPGFMLNDYTYMPYGQFKANENAERGTQHATSIRNNTNTNQSVSYTLTAKESKTGYGLFSGGGSTINIPPYTQQSVVFNTYTNTLNPNPPGDFDWVNFENKYYIQAVSSTDFKDNDTIVRNQVFNNEFAYDDGTAEKSYYLNLFPTLPGKVAVEFHLNKPDTIKGLSVYFGRQFPMGYNKYFTIEVFEDISYGGGTDKLVYYEEFLDPGYLSVNNFYVYKFEKPTLLKAGTFYVSIMQPALSSSDSLYYGLDVNRVGGNHLYYNVLGYWESSTVSGAVMMRPVFGPIIASEIKEVVKETKEIKWTISPDPAADRLQFHYPGGKKGYFELYNMEGRMLKKGNVANEEIINISELAQGIYFVRFSADGVYSTPQKLIKL